MNIIIEESRCSGPDHHIREIFLKYEDTFIDLILESTQQNFEEYISNSVLDISSFLLGVQKITQTLYDNLKYDYISGNVIRKDLLLQVTKHSFSDREVEFEELMLDFPIGHALFTLNWYYHSGYFQGSHLTPEQRNDFCKGMCLGAHMCSFAIFLFFRYEVFQDITFLRFMKDYKTKQVFITYPETLKQVVAIRAGKFDWSLIMNKHA
ncbi:MAG: hypothetical protein HQK52_09030 [Oligoflexia bacterium]|nr:hypothetical protein [Oligoflexia bacterium]